MLARGIVGIAEASATASPSTPYTRPSPSTTRPIAHVPTGWKNPRRFAAMCASRRDVAAGEVLASGEISNPVDQRPEALHALGQHLGVTGVGEEAVLDRERGLRIEAVSRTVPRERGFIANTAALTSKPSGPRSSDGNVKRSHSPGSHARLADASVTCAMKSGRSRS